MNHIPIRRALLSVSDKTNMVGFAKQLTNLGIEIISTGGTSQALREANVPHRQVDELTQLPASGQSEREYKSITRTRVFARSRCFKH